MIPAISAECLRILVAGHSSLYDLGRMFQMLPCEQGSAIHVVHSMETAFALLSLKSPDFRPVELT